ncbi:hypothetical protein ACLOJK_009406 [Asimina triloba]
MRKNERRARVKYPAGSDISSFSSYPPHNTPPAHSICIHPRPCSSNATMADDYEFYHHGPHRYAGSKVMLIAFFSLAFVVFLIVFLIVYARCISGRRARRRALIHHLNTPANPAQTHIHEPPKTGLDPAVIATLPTFEFKKTDAVPNENGAECAVCLSALEEAETARILPNCKHVFHMQCIDMWLSSHSTCPICRTGAEPRAQAASEPAAFAASAPPLDRSVSMGLEGTSSDNAMDESSKAGGSRSVSRLSSFRRILSRERSERGMQSASRTPSYNPTDGECFFRCEVGDLVNTPILQSIVPRILV